jgi:guanylate kinase
VSQPARLTVVSGPSGAGKGSVIAAVLRRHPQVWLSVSATTRAPRPGEEDGIDYHFVDEAEFARMVSAGASYAGSSYGTPRQPVEDKLAAGIPVLLEIELQGARLVRQAMPDARLVFLAPPSFEELARRLNGRGTEDADRIRNRLDRARIEMAAEDEFDATVINDDIEAAAQRLVALMEIT